MPDKNKYSISLKDLLNQTAGNPQTGKAGTDASDTTRYNAKLDTAYNILMKHEGYYDPGITENETTRGIDRGMQPGWPGWKNYIEPIKQKNKFYFEPIHVAEMISLVLSDSKVHQKMTSTQFQLYHQSNMLQIADNMDNELSKNDKITQQIRYIKDLQPNVKNFGKVKAKEIRQLSKLIWNNPVISENMGQMQSLLKKDKNIQLERHTIDSLLQSDKGIEEQIAKFYQKEFWNRMKLDKINNQQIVNTMLDGGVNQGIAPMDSIVQRSVNKLIKGTGSNLNLQSLTVDGSIGQGTIDDVNKLILHGHAAELYDEINQGRLNRYIHTKGYNIFKKAWGDRLKPYGWKPDKTYFVHPWDKYKGVVNDNLMHFPPFADPHMQTDATFYKKPVIRPISFARHLHSGGSDKYYESMIDKFKPIPISHILTHDSISPVLIHDSLFNSKSLQDSIRHPLSLDTGFFDKGNHNFIVPPITTDSLQNKTDTTHIQKPQKPPEKSAKNTNIHIGNVGCGLTVKTEMPINQLEIH